MAVDALADRFAERAAHQAGGDQLGGAVGGGLGEHLLAGPAFERPKPQQGDGLFERRDLVADRDGGGVDHAQQGQRHRRVAADHRRHRVDVHVGIAEQLHQLQVAGAQHRQAVGVQPDRLAEVVAFQQAGAGVAGVFDGVERIDIPGHQHGVGIGAAGRRRFAHRAGVRCPEGDEADPPAQRFGDQCGRRHRGAELLCVVGGRHRPFDLSGSRIRQIQFDRHRRRRVGAAGQVGQVGVGGRDDDAVAAGGSASGVTGEGDAHRAAVPGRHAQTLHPLTPVAVTLAIQREDGDATKQQLGILSRGAQRGTPCPGAPGGIGSPTGPKRRARPATPRDGVRVLGFESRPTDFDIRPRLRFGWFQARGPASPPPSATDVRRCGGGVASVSSSPPAVAFNAA